MCSCDWKALRLLLSPEPKLNHNLYYYCCCCYYFVQAQEGCPGSPRHLGAGYVWFLLYSGLRVVLKENEMVPARLGIWFVNFPSRPYRKILFLKNFWSWKHNINFPFPKKECQKKQKACNSVSEWHLHMVGIKNGISSYIDSYLPLLTLSQKSVLGPSAYLPHFPASSSFKYVSVRVWTSVFQGTVPAAPRTRCCQVSL